MLHDALRERRRVLHQIRGPAPACACNALQLRLNLVDRLDGQAEDGGDVLVAGKCGVLREFGGRGGGGILAVCRFDTEDGGGLVVGDPATRI